MLSDRRAPHPHVLLHVLVFMLMLMLTVTKSWRAPYPHKSAFVTALICRTWLAFAIIDFVPGAPRYANAAAKHQYRPSRPR